MCSEAGPWSFSHLHPQLPLRNCICPAVLLSVLKSPSWDDQWHSDMLWSCQSGTLGPFLARVGRQDALPFCSYVLPWLQECHTLPTEPLPSTTESTSRPGVPYLQTSCVTINLSPWSPWWCRYQWPQRWEWCPLPWMSYLRHGGCQG